MSNEPKHTNRLINETSPYLLQHAHNPVDWHPWGPEALEKAKKEDKPILLSIGYSACHWCHVMEHESFENEEIAGLMNEHFICIKVDREERPDLDQVYMNAVQMLTGRGGWPMTVFLTPERVPFYGGTYFPPESRYGMPGFPALLLSIADLYKSQRDKVMTTAEEILARLNDMNDFRSTNELLTPEHLDRAYDELASQFDSMYGGFGRAPKFPAAMTLTFLLRTYHRTKKQAALDMVEYTLEKMGQGGIYDHVGGGFHRYSVDERWLVPHFEKMLYDNALLVRVYLYAYQVTHKPFYRRIAEETLDFVLKEMTDPQGGFYSTLDADSEGHEGKFYLWTPDEIIEALGDKDARIFCLYYDVTEHGNFEGKNILNVRFAPEAIAEKFNLSLNELTDILSRGRSILYAARSKRVWPERDEKILTAWNGLMLRSFAEAASILDRPDYRDVAVRNVEFVLTHLRREGGLLRTFKDGSAKHVAYLEDYSQFIDGLLALYEATFDVRWIEEARILTDRMIREYWDPGEEGFYFAGSHNEPLISQVKDFYDNATPSGNSVAADVLLRLGLLFNHDDYPKKALAILRKMSAAMQQVPMGFGHLLGALDFYLSTPKEICVVGKSVSHDTKELLRVIYDRYLPNRIVALKEPGDQRLQTILPLTRQRNAIDGHATAYVCTNFTCKEPVTTPEGLATQLQTQ